MAADYANDLVLSWEHIECMVSIALRLVRAVYRRVRGALGRQRGAYRLATPTRALDTTQYYSLHSETHPFVTFATFTCRPRSLF